jgi:hypothetical protein
MADRCGPGRYADRHLPGHDPSAHAGKSRPKLAGRHHTRRVTTVYGRPDKQSVLLDRNLVLQCGCNPRERRDSMVAAESYADCSDVPSGVCDHLHGCLRAPRPAIDHLAATVKVAFRIGNRPKDPFDCQPRGFREANRDPSLVCGGDSDRPTRCASRIHRLAGSAFLR